MSIYESKEARKIIKSAIEQATIELALKPDHMRGKGDPNHPMYNNHIFGYEQNRFLSMQHK